MLWKKNKSGLPGPKRLPNPVGRAIATELGWNPDRIWNFEFVIRPKEGKKDTYEVRVFEETQAALQRVIVKDYNSLNEYPELILYEGWVNQKGAKLEKRC